MRNHYNIRSSASGLTIVAIIIAILCMYFLVEFSNTQTQRHTVYSIDQVTRTSGDSEYFSTEYYYQVSTNKGSYKIKTEGFNAHPECVKIQKDSTYLLTTRGLSIPFFGVYPKIISVSEIHH